MTRARHGEAAVQPRWRGCVLLPSTRLPSTILESTILESKAGIRVWQCSGAGPTAVLCVCATSHGAQLRAAGGVVAMHTPVTCSTVSRETVGVAAKVTATTLLGRCSWAKTRLLEWSCQAVSAGGSDRGETRWGARVAGENPSSPSRCLPKGAVSPHLPPSQHMVPLSKSSTSCKPHTRQHTPWRLKGGRASRRSCC
jgi:hypothetical protein